MGECIEWKTVIERFKKLYCKYCQNYNGVGCNACCDEVDILKCIRPVALKELPPMAKWIAQDDTFTRFECSVCHTKNHHTRWNYCPNCGARMEEEE